MLLSILSNDHQTRRIGLSGILFFWIVFAGAAKSSGQDLGALARQEQARKESQPIHPVHVYTNDDLLRPRILVPEESVDLGTARRKLSPALMELPPAIESDVQEISLGEVARKYREQKLTSQPHSPEVAHLSEPVYVYTNDDLALPKILTPQDQIKYEVALEKPVPVDTRIPAEVAADEFAPPEAPLGDIARAVYHQQEGVLETHKGSLGETQGPIRPSTHRTGKLVAAFRTNRPAHLPTGITSIVRLRTRRHAEPQWDGSSNIRFEAVTVRSGDSLWKLARRHLGHGLRWRELLQANPWITDPHQLRIGSQIRIDGLERYSRVELLASVR